MPRRFWILIVLAACLSACSSLWPEGPSPTQGVAVPPAGSPAALATPAFSSAGRALNLWVPPEFSPDEAGEASTLLADRLRAFEASHPGVRVVVRVKGRSGPAGLTETLAAAYQAAPSILPDLVALDGPELALAHERQVILAWQEIDTIPEDWNWIAPILDGARSQGQVAGLPFAAHADVFAFQPQAYPGPPHTWADLLTGSGSFIFPAGDPWSTFTLAQYLSVGGNLRNAEGSPALDVEALQDVLAFYAAARAGGLLPLSSRQHENSSATAEALSSGQVGAAVVPFSRIADLEAYDLQIAGPWPSRDGQGTCFVNPWSWAVVARPSAPEPLTIELATWLAQPEFTGPWTRALNLLPASESALAGWPEDGKRSLAGLLGTACLPLPSPDDLALFGPVLRDAAGAALTGELTPEVAARLASAALARP
jgi:ABC-type glycerol-3-phosphate transport system substrate-binding protein